MPQYHKVVRLDRRTDLGAQHYLMLCAARNVLCAPFVNTCSQEGGGLSCPDTTYSPQRLCLYKPRFENSTTICMRVETQAVLNPAFIIYGGPLKYIWAPHVEDEDITPRFYTHIQTRTGDNDHGL